MGVSLDRAPAGMVAATPMQSGSREEAWRATGGKTRIGRSAARATGPLPRVC